MNWFVREVAFTHLNRLVALKCLEVRDLIPEIITVRDAYGGRSRAHYDYRNAHPDEAHEADDALPAAIRHVCRQVYAEFKFLFDVGDPATGGQPPANSILWPSYPVLKECIGLINGLDEAADNDGRTLWAEDEIIGWIYQFYNAEQKEAIRKRGRPRRPAEVAVINQFFTPRWICKFLVDNTLGRLWLEMHPDSERVRAKCDYLVPEPLPQGSESASQRGDFADSQTRRFALDPDSPINNPKAPPRREPKRPQDIRLIDPACGTMHFGHYAFEVFQEIYRDALEHGWLDDSPSPDGRERGAGGEGDIPAAILRHNLYGVDIDLRAVQLAGLSLFIKAKTANPDAHISHVNLVVADAVLPADGARQRFLDQYKDDKMVQNAVRQVLDEMGDVAEVGSLLRVEERLQDILAKAGRTPVSGGNSAIRNPKSEMAQLSLAEAAGAVPEEWGAHYTLARLLDDLRAFAAEALQTHDLNAQLFAQEAEKTVHLLDVFLNDYDVVVMNPPFGNIMYDVQKSLKRLYPNSYHNVLCAFLDRGKPLVRNSSGLVGAIIDKSSTLRSRYEPFREHVLIGNGALVTLVDLGWEVLDDANVETEALVLRDDFESRSMIASFFRVTDEPPELKDSKLRSLIDHLRMGQDSDDIFAGNPLEFKVFPNKALSYWVPSAVRRLFVEYPSLDPSLAAARVGVSPFNAELFYRYIWEIAPEEVGGEKWVPLANGGPFSPFYRAIDQVVFFEDDGNMLKNYVSPSGYSACFRSPDFQFTEGITYGKRGHWFNVQYLQSGCIFSDEGQGVFPNSGDDLWFLMGLLNSNLIRTTINTYCGQHKHCGYVKLLPVPHIIPESARAKAGTYSLQAHNLKAAWDTGNETCTRFDASWLIQAHRGTLLADFPDLHPADQPTSQLASLLDYVLAVEQAADAHLQELQTQIDEVVYDLYEISPEDRALIERELGDQPPELVWPQMEGTSDKEKRREHVRRLVSYFLLQALKEKRDGILPLTSGTGQDTTLDEVRRRLEAEFGEAAAFRMETEIKQVMGQGIADWLDGPFFKWHTKLYKRRPIVWHLASPGKAFACFLHYHKLDRDTLRKVQTLYLWPRRRAAEAELETARAAKASRRIEQAEAVLDDLAEFEKRLLAVIQADVECDIPDWAEGPFQDGVYDPVLDDGVKVNIVPLQEAGVLRYGKVV